jgi:hypothetical protein
LGTFHSVSLSLINLQENLNMDMAKETLCFINISIETIRNVVNILYVGKADVKISDSDEFESVIAAFQLKGGLLKSIVERRTSECDFSNRQYLSVLKKLERAESSDMIAETGASATDKTSEDSGVISDLTFKDEVDDEKENRPSMANVEMASTSNNPTSTKRKVKRIRSPKIKKEKSKLPKKIQEEKFVCPQCDVKCKNAEQVEIHYQRVHLLGHRR